MKKIITYALLFSGLVLSAAVFAGGRSSAAGPASGLVRADVMSSSLDTVRLFVPDGNEVLCKGENIPVYRMESGMKGMLSSKDLSGRKVVGEIRVERLIGDSYAEGSLVLGKATSGDIALKTRNTCMKG